MDELKILEEIHCLIAHSERPIPYILERYLNHENYKNNKLTRDMLINELLPLCKLLNRFFFCHNSANDEECIDVAN